jgi:hypothetical protein
MTLITCYTCDGDIVTDIVKIQKLDFDYAQITLFGKHAEETVSGNIMLVSARDYKYATEFKWYLNRSGYPGTYGSYDGGVKFSRPVTFHQLVMKQLTSSHDLVVDHINRNKLDNRRANLRLCTALENSYNKSKAKNSSGKYKGVVKRGKKNPLYVASITKNGIKHEIKGCSTEEDAAKMYDIMAEELFGQYAAKNFLKS